MRMWGVDPGRLCDKHLLGEHSEMHMAVGSINAGRSVAGHVERGQLVVPLIRKRHRDLMLEMHNRGMQHNSPLPMMTARIPRQVTVANNLDVAANEKELLRRCAGCRAQVKAYVPVHAGKALVFKRIGLAADRARRRALRTRKPSVAELVRRKKLQMQGKLF